MADISAVNQIEITAKDSTGGVFAAVENEIKHLDTVTGGLATRLASLSGVMGALGGVLGIGVFTDAVAGAIEYQASLANLAQRTGATVEALSAMNVAARLSDTSMDLVAATMGRFAASIVAAQAGTGKQAAALQALGFNAKTFATQYQTTDQALLAVARALDQYQDGLGKTASEEDLMGKSGAQLGAFLHEFAVDGTNAVKVTAQQAEAARELNDSITKLKSAWSDLLNKLGVELVPVLQKVIDGFDTFAKIGAAALVAFVAWPAAVTAISTALTAYKEAAISAALANEVLGASTSVLGTSWAATIASATAQFGTLAGLLKSIPAMLFAGFAGWEFGKWLSDNFLQAKLAGIAFVDGTMTAWEALKYAAGVTWAAIVYGWDQAVESMKVSFGAFLALVASGLSHVPGLGGFAAEVSSFAASLESSSGGALAKFHATMASVGAEFDAGRAKVHGITSDLADYAIEAARSGAASTAAAKAPPPVPGATVKAAQDASKALAEFQKAMEGLQTAYSDALAKGQQQAITSSLADVKRLYDQGVIDFKQYWDAQTALQADALDVQEQQVKDHIAHQQALVESLQQVVVGIDPSKFKSYELYLAAAYAAEAKLITANADLVNSQGDLNVLTQKSADVGKDYIENYLVPASNGLLKLSPELDKEIAQRQRQNEEIGLTATQIAALNIQRAEEARQMTLMAGPPAAGVLEFYDAELDRLHKLYDLAAQGEDAQRMVDGWKNLFQSAADEGAKFISDFVQHGGSAFKSLWDDFEKWALESFAKIAAQTIVVNLAGAFSPQLAGLASNTFAGGNNGLLSLLTGGSNILAGGGSDMLSGALNLVNAGAGTASLMAFGGANASQAALLAAQTADFGVSGTSATLSALGAGSAVSTVGAFVPYVAIVLAAASALGLFDHKGGPKSGGFGEAGTDIGRFYTPTSADSDLATLATTTQSSYAQALTSLGGTGSGGFAFGYDTDPQGTAASRLSLAASVNGQQVYGFSNRNEGSGTKQLEADLSVEAQRAILAALQASKLPDDVAKIIDSIAPATATADAIQRVLQVAGAFHAISSSLTSSEVGTALQALTGADQATSDKVLAFATVLANLGGALPGVRAQLDTLSATAIPGFIDALGGAKAALGDFQYLQDNFLTSAQKLSQATQLLNTDFGKLGLAVPSTHQQFLDLLSSFDLTTDAGRSLYASVMALAPLFVEVHGTADQAASALTSVNTALQQTAAVANSVSSGQLINAGIEDANAVIKNIQSLASSSNLDYATNLAQEITELQAALAHPPQYLATDPSTLAGYTDAINAVMQPLQDDLTRFTTLSGQYGDAMAQQLVALQDWYNTQAQALGGYYGNSLALSNLATIFKQKWDAIVNGTASGVAAVQDQLTKLQQSIAQYLQGLVVGQLSPLAPMQQLAEAQQAYQAELVKAQGGDQGALGDVTKYADTYLQHARDAYASSQAYTDIFNQITQQLGALAGTGPDGQPLAAPATAAASPTVAIAAALPQGSTLASSADVSSVVAALAALQAAVAADNAKTRQLYQALIAALANSNSADAQAIVKQLQSGGMLSSALADRSRVVTGTAANNTPSGTTSVGASLGLPLVNGYYVDSF